MKIALTGSHGVGKTTLAKALAEELDTHLIPEGARELINEWQVEPWNLPPEQKTDFQIEVMRRQLDREIMAKSFVSDRSGYDILAYTYGLDVYSKLRDEFLLHIKANPYDLVIRVPIAFDIDPDGRSTDKKYQREIDVKIVQEMEKLGQPFYTLKGQSSVENRVKQIITLL